MAVQVTPPSVLVSTLYVVALSEAVQVRLTAVAELTVAVTVGASGSVSVALPVVSAEVPWALMLEMRYV